jgi:hypothetical protein
MEETLHTLLNRALRTGVESLLAALNFVLGGRESWGEENKELRKLIGGSRSFQRRR